MIVYDEARLAAGGEPLPPVPVAGAALVHRKPFRIWKFALWSCVAVFVVLWLFAKAKTMFLGEPPKPVVVQPVQPVQTPTTRPYAFNQFPPPGSFSQQSQTKPQVVVRGVMGRLVRTDTGVVEWRMRHDANIARQNDSNGADVVYAKSSGSDFGSGGGR